MVLTLSFMFASAPWPRNSFATASSPLTTAQISAVLPSYERQHNLDHTPSPILKETADTHPDTHRTPFQPSYTTQYVCMYNEDMNCTNEKLFTLLPLMNECKYACKMYAFISEVVLANICIYLAGNGLVYYAI